MSNASVNHELIRVSTHPCKTLVNTWQERKMPCTFELFSELPPSDSYENLDTVMDKFSRYQFVYPTGTQDFKQD